MKARERGGVEPTETEPTEQAAENSKDKEPPPGITEMDKEDIYSEPTGFTALIEDDERMDIIGQNGNDGLHYEDVAPNHVKRIKELANSGKYDNVVFHRVIDGFMAQTGDVKFGNSESKDFNLSRAGMGGSDLPDLQQEFSSLPHERGTLSMARSSDPNSANSQFFICFKPAPFLDNQYTVFGKVVEGMEYVDKIKRGDESNNGSVSDPDKIISFKSL